MWFILGSEAERQRASGCSPIWRLLCLLSAGPPSPDRWESGASAAGAVLPQSFLRGPRKPGARSQLMMRHYGHRASH